MIPVRQCEIHLHKRDMNHEDTKNTKDDKKITIEKKALTPS
jgi:hypothetical protein